jgi:hypothetical protein
MQWEMAAYELLVLVNNRRWELVLGHCRAMIALATAGGWHLSRHLRAFLLSSSTNCALQQFGAWSSCRGSYSAPWAFSTKAWMEYAYSCGVIHCLPWSSRASHWPLPCSPPQSPLSEQYI